MTWAAMTWALAIGGSLGALSFLVVARRGRVVDDHPLCRRCGFDLFGTPHTTDRCNECGRDLRAPGAIRIGHRKPIGWLTWASSLTLAACLLVLAIQIATASGRFNWRAYAPLGWLQRDAASPDATVRDPALAEILRRVEAKAISAKQASSLVEQALTHQADASQAWVPRWGELLERLRDQQQVSNEQWGRYAMQAFSQGLTARPKVVKGDPLPLEFNHPGKARLFGRRFEAFFRWESLVVAGVPAQPFYRRPTPGNENEYHGRMDLDGGGMSYYTPVVAAEDLVALAPAANLPVEATLEVAIYESQNSTSFTPPPVEPIATFTRKLTAVFELLPEGTPFEHTVVDPSQRDAMRTSAKATREVRDGRVTVHLQSHQPPVPLYADVRIRKPSGQTIDLNMNLWVPAGGIHGHASTPESGTLTADEPATLVITPNLDTLRRRTTIEPAWGEVIEIPLPPADSDTE
jgi:hypothetical protein